MIYVKFISVCFDSQAINLNLDIIYSKHFIVYFEEQKCMFIRLQ